MADDIEAMTRAGVTMTDQPNTADFSVNDKPREYDVSIRVEGEIRRTIKADSLEESEALAEKIADDIAGGWAD